MKYDALPKVVDKASFTEMAKDSPVGIIYRGITANTQEKAKQYVEAFMYGKMFAGKAMHTEVVHIFHWIKVKLRSITIRVLC